MRNHRSVSPSRGPGLVDVQSWVPEPSDLSSVGLGGSLCEAILNLFIPLTRHIMRESQTLSPEATISSIPAFRLEVERFFLWCQGFSTGTGRLDDILSKSQELRFCILTALHGLGSCIRDGVSRFLDKGSWAEEPVQDLQRLLEQAAIALGLSELEGLEEEEHCSEDSEPSADDTLEVADFTGLVATYIDCLMDSSTALQNPLVDVDLSGVAQTYLSLETFDVSSPQASAFCRKIRDRFPKMPKWLVERLGEGNACRASILTDLRADLLEIEAVNPEAFKDLAEPENSLMPSEALMSSDRKMKMTNTTRSTYQSDSLFDKSQAGSSLAAPLTHLSPPGSPKRIVNLDPGDDISSVGSCDVSVATFASFNTTLSALKGSRARVPPLPDEATQGKPFVCYICNQSVTENVTRITWKKHVFADLCPYICTFFGCETSSKLFQSSGAWAKHESSHRPDSWSPSVCQFCELRFPDGSIIAYRKHVAEHLREISLAALPQLTNPDDALADDSDSSVDSLSGEDGKRTGQWQYGSTAGPPPPERPHEPKPRTSRLDGEGSDASSWETDPQVDEPLKGLTESKGAPHGWRPLAWLTSPNVDVADVLAEPPARLTKQHYRFVSSNIRNRKLVKASKMRGKHRSLSKDKDSTAAIDRSGASPESRPPAPQYEDNAEANRLKSDVKVGFTHGPLPTYRAVPDSMHESFLAFVNKGPESKRGLSWNKALKRFHREQEATVGRHWHSKLMVEQEMWRRLRMKRNERGEVVLFAGADDDTAAGAPNASHTDVAEGEEARDPDDESKEGGEISGLGKEDPMDSMATVAEYENDVKHGLREGEKVARKTVSMEDADNGGERTPKVAEGIPADIPGADEDDNRGRDSGFIAEAGSGSYEGPDLGKG